MAQSKIFHPYDAALALRSLTDRATAVTASGTSTGAVNLHHIAAGNGTYVGTPGIPGALGDVAGQFAQDSFDVVVNVDDIDSTSGTETYAVKLVAVDSNMANPVDVPASLINITAGMVGSPLVITVNPRTLVEAAPNAAYIQVAHVLGGATPSMHYYAFASKHQGV